MSSFIVSISCMQNIIEGLFWHHQFRERYGNLYEKQNLYHESGDFNVLAENLYLLNQAGVMQRYPDKPDSNYVKIPKFNWRNKPVNDMQLLKSLQCLRYQCCEGDIDKEPLYKWLQDMISCLMDFIIDKMPEYDKAKWD
ncbi:hypothetical protein LCGC14_3114020 [marine sediment metagenome]|uniref:Uncharacterized protein n=1 Tax=marine sediment metagenome TaxID=412755 RepID=A0A0F8W478_9ZZZZ